MAESVYDAAGGAPAILALAHAWHERCLDDPVVSHAFSHGFRPDHTERLAAHWVESLGGPAEFSDSMGTQTEVLQMHAGMGEHEEMDRRAIACFVAAMDDAGLPEDPALRRSLTDWFTEATAAMAAHPDSPDDVPDGLPVPVWRS